MQLAVGVKDEIGSVTAVFLPVAHAVLLGTCVAMFSSQRSGLVGALSGVAVLGLMAKLPDWAVGAALGLDSGETTGRLPHGGRSVGRAVAVVTAVKTGGLSAGVAAAVVHGSAPPCATPGRRRASREGPLRPR